MLQDKCKKRSQRSKFQGKRPWTKTAYGSAALHTCDPRRPAFMIQQSLISQHSFTLFSSPTIDLSFFRAIGGREDPPASVPSPCWATRLQLISPPLTCLRVWCGRMPRNDAILSAKYAETMLGAASGCCTSTVALDFRNAAKLDRSLTCPKARFNQRIHKVHYWLSRVELIRSASQEVWTWPQRIDKLTCRLT